MDPALSHPGPVPAAAFDFDGTVIRGDSALWLLRYVLRERIGAWPGMFPVLTSLAGFALGRRDRVTVKNAVLGVVDSIPEAEREGFFGEFHDRVLRPRYLPRALERIQWHRDQGHRLILASASVDLYLRHAVRHLAMDHLICTPAALRPRTRVTGENCRGSEKVRRISESDFSTQIDWSRSYAYSDSLSDLPLFRLCGHPVAVNPRRTLRRHAGRSGWMVLDW